MLTGDIRREGAPIGPEATCGEARLEIADGAPGIAIVDRAGRALGLVSRAALFAAALDKPITALAEAQPLVVESSIELAALESQLLANASALVAGFLIVEGGRYVAVGDTAAALRAFVRERAETLNHIHGALEMGDVAVWKIDYANRQLLGAGSLSTFVGRRSRLKTSPAIYGRSPPRNPAPTLPIASRRSRWRATMTDISNFSTA